METVRWVYGVFRSPRQFAHTASALLRCGFEREDIVEGNLITPVPSHGPSNEELQDVAAQRTSGGVVLDSITLQAAIYMLEGMGPVTEGSPIDPLFAETLAGISIAIRCVDLRKANRAEALLRGAGAQEVSTEVSTTG